MVKHAEGISIQELNDTERELIAEISRKRGLTQIQKEVAVEIVKIRFAKERAEAYARQRFRIGK